MPVLRPPRFTSTQLGSADAMHAAGFEVIALEASVAGTRTCDELVALMISTATTLRHARAGRAHDTAGVRTVEHDFSAQS